MPGVVERIIPSDAMDILHTYVSKVVDFGVNGELKVIAANFIDDVRNDLAKSAVPEYEVEEDEKGNPKADPDGNPVFKLDDTGAKVKKIREDGKQQLLVPMARQYTLSIDGLNAVWLLIKEHLLSGSAKSHDIASAKIVCGVFGMKKRWASIADAVVDASKEVPLDGLPTIEVPLD